MYEGTDRLRELSALFLVCLFTLTVVEKWGKRVGEVAFFVEKQKKFPENLEISKKVCTFAPANDEKVQMPSKKDRDLAQLVAHTSGGREVAGSSPVIPTKVKGAENQRVSAPFPFSPNYTVICSG